MGDARAELTPSKPYLLRALHEWLVDNGLSPHLIVNARHAGVVIPEDAVKDGKLVLNIAPRAVRGLALENHAVSFQARFSGRPFAIHLPMDAILAIYARENGQGMMFAGEEAADAEQAASGPPADESGPAPRGGPHLKVIK